MLWFDKLTHWKNGIIPTHDMTSRYMFETSPITADGENEYDETLISCKKLNNIKNQNYLPFEENIKNSNNKYIAVFPNVSKSTLLCVPIPRKNKNFLSIKDFIDNASLTQQCEFWKQVAYEIENQLQFHDKLYISTHGLGVHYFHLRIEPIPKYYVTKKYIQD